MWSSVCDVLDVPSNGGACVKIGDKQIAIFHFSDQQSWYAVDNLCPHSQQMVLSRGLLGETGGLPKITCPLHKQSFCLTDGHHLGGQAEFKLQTYPIKVDAVKVYLNLTPQDVTYDDS